MICKYFNFETINESERFLFFSFLHGKDQTRPYCHFFGFYDKILGTTKISEVDHTNRSPVINDIDNFAPLHSFLWSSNQSGEMVAYMEAGDIADWFEENPEKVKALPQQLQKLSKLTSEDNPVVVIAKLKQ